MNQISLTDIFSWLAQLALLLVALVFMERLIHIFTVNIKDKKQLRVIFWIKWLIRVLFIIFTASISLYFGNVQSIYPFYSFGSQISDFLASKTASILLTIIISYVAIFVLGFINQRLAIESTFNRRKVRLETLRNVSVSALRVIIVVFAITNILSHLGVNITALLAGVSVIGLAVSFGAQSLVRDIINGFFILFEDQYGVGDVIRINGASGLSGTVEALSLRATVLRDLEGTAHVIPNGQILTVSVLSKDWARAVVDIEVPQTANFDETIDLIDKVANELYQDVGFKEKFLGKPEVLGVQSFTSSGAIIRTTMKVMPKEQWAIARELRKRLKTALNYEASETNLPKVSFRTK